MIVDVETGRQVASESLPDRLYSAAVDLQPGWPLAGRQFHVLSPAAQVRDAETGRLVHSLSLGVSESDDVVIRRSDGRLLTIRGEDLREWDLPAAKPASLDAGLVLENIGGPAAVHNREIVLARGGRQLLVVQAPDDPSQPSELAVHDVTTGEVIRHFPSREPGAVPDPNSQVNVMQSNSAGTKLAAVIGDRISWDQTTVGYGSGT